MMMIRAGRSEAPGEEEKTILKTPGEKRRLKVDPQLACCMHVISSHVRQEKLYAQFGSNKQHARKS